MCFTCTLTVSLGTKPLNDLFKFRKIIELLSFGGAKKAGSRIHIDEEREETLRKSYRGRASVDLFQARTVTFLDLGWLCDGILACILKLNVVQWVPSSEWVRP